MTIAVSAAEPAAITRHFPFLGSTRANVEVSRQWSRELDRSLSASVRTIQSACCSSSLSHSYPVRRGMPQWTVERTPETLSVRVDFNQRTGSSMDTNLADAANTLLAGTVEYAPKRRSAGRRQYDRSRPVSFRR